MQKKISLFYVKSISRNFSLAHQTSTGKWWLIEIPTKEKKRNRLILTFENEK